MIDPGERVAVFIDGANLFATARALGFDIDYRRLLDYCRRGGYLVRAYYYTLLMPDEEPSGLRTLVDWLEYNGYSVVSKSGRKGTDTEGRRRVWGSMDMELAIDALELARHVEHVILFSGDSDFGVLIDALQRKGCRVSVVSSAVSHPPMIGSDLRRRADVFIDLADIRREIIRA